MENSVFHEVLPLDIIVADVVVVVVAISVTNHHDLLQHSFLHDVNMPDIVGVAQVMPLKEFELTKHRKPQRFDSIMIVKSIVVVVVLQ